MYPMIYDDELTLNDCTQMLWDEMLDIEPIWLADRSENMIKKR